MASSGGSWKSGRSGGEAAATMRKERRFEDIVSDEIEDEDVLPAFLQGGKEGSSSASGSYPDKSGRRSPLRKPRSTLQEQIGEDGFIFSAVGPSTSTSRDSRPKIPGARGPPPSSSTVRERIAEAETPIIRRNQQKRKEIDGLPSSTSDEEQRFRPSTTEKRQPSDSVKRIRRTSLLKDGTPAYPHPSISDADLHNYCSADLDPEERMKHVAGWILERRLQDLKSSNLLEQKQAEVYRGALLAALKATLHDLNKGSFDTQRGSSQRQQSLPANSTSKLGLSGVGKDKMTPNARNRKKKVELEEVVQSLKREKAAWEKEQKELDRLRQEIDALSREDDEVDDDADIEHILDLDGEEGQWSAEERRQLELVKRVLDKGKARASSGLGRADAGQHLSSLDAETDPRWKDVEFNADLLLSKTHTFAQLSSLSQRYIAAVSARGAKALKEMTEGPRQKLGSLHSLASSSTISRESRDNLDQILSEIRTIEEEASDDEGGPDRGIGEVSEGEILRAYAQMS